MINNLIQNCDSIGHKNEPFSEVAFGTASEVDFGTASEVASEITSSIQSLTETSQDISSRDVSPIKPTTFNEKKGIDEKVVNSYSSSELVTLDFDHGVRISDEVSPKILEIRTPSDNTQIIYISNKHYPEGTIAGSSTLDKCIMTDKLIYCAAITVVDKSHNKQTLIHVFPGCSVKANKNIIEYILSQSNEKDLEISVIPGFYYGTSVTIEFIIKTLNELVPNVKINFYNFPDQSEGIGRENRALILQNGELFCCNDYYEFKCYSDDKKALFEKNRINPNNLNINPPGNITYVVRT